MASFRRYLITIWLVLAIYTLVVGTRHGWNLLPIFFSSIFEMTWAGQFNMDFMTFLSLSALWVAWRHEFSPGGLALGVVAFFGGMMFLALYLVIAGSQAQGDIKVVLLGKTRALA